MTKKIMFSDRFGLTAAVLEGRKTMTRRLLPQDKINGRWDYNSYYDYCLKCKRLGKNEITWDEWLILHHGKYKVGEVVAVAQNYQDVYEELKRTHGSSSSVTREFFHKYVQGGRMPVSNKMFVRADLMPHHIRITDIKVERLQDISEEDVYKEGFTHEFVNNNWGNSAYHEEAILIYYDNIGLTKEIRSRDPKEAFSFLIDKVSGKDTWESNPWVFAYEFKLVK